MRPERGSAPCWCVVARRRQRHAVRPRARRSSATPPTSSSPASATRTASTSARCTARSSLVAGLYRRLGGARLAAGATCSPASCSARCTACAPTSRTSSTACRCSYVDRQPRGDLLSRVTNDIDNVAQSLQQTLSQLLTSVLTIVGVLIMMFTISPLLALVALVTVPLSLLHHHGPSPSGRSSASSPSGATPASLNAQVEEAFTGHALVKVFGRQHEVEAALPRRRTRSSTRPSFGAQFIAGIIQPAMMFLGNLNFVAIAVIGGLRVASGAMTLGDVQAFIQYSRQFTQPLTQVASMANVLQSGIASAERVFELLDAPRSDADPTEPRHVERPRGRVEFEHVSFSYDPDEAAHRGPVARRRAGPDGRHRRAHRRRQDHARQPDHALLRARRRRASRSTASTSPQMPRGDLRSNIGMVLQDTWLFGGTIRDNIAYGNLDATEEQILDAAKATYVDRFVHSLPDGYDTVIDDEGGNVSAGEKQLLTIARAFLADPTILILDEATSSVDTRTEVLIQQAMAALRSNRTSFVIAHRLSTIRDADIILVMDDGQIVEQGNHDELLAAGGAYANLYNAQFAAPAVDVDAEAEAAGVWVGASQPVTPATS